MEREREMEREKEMESSRLTEILSQVCNVCKAEIIWLIGKQKKWRTSVKSLCVPPADIMIATSFLFHAAQRTSSQPPLFWFGSVMSVSFFLSRSHY